jgi:solute carrier family 25 2-oxodicarboxylate transporter 21|mmetsp:Transcript_5595/g.9114  ORF Transcript_5595/g.9114 Transcript_5595/m.9114 type:complete len:303 (-) Transcript_5595:229-1137(-)
MAAKRKATPTDTLPPTFAGAGVMSVVMYPVDVVRALCMSTPGLGAKDALTGFVKDHGLIGFVKQGMAVEVFRSSLARGIKFWVQPMAKNKLLENGWANNFVTSGTAGVIAVFPEVWAISSMENIKLAQQLDSKGQFNGAADVARHLIKTRGVFGGLYCGYFGMQLRQILFTGATFASIDLCKDGLRGVGLNNAMALDVVGGFMSGVVGVGFNCWTDVVRSVVQKKAIAASFDPTAKAPSQLEPLSPVPFFKETAALMKTKGIGGLYAGVGPKMVHLGLGNSILFVLMPRFKEMWFNSQGIQL